MAADRNPTKFPDEETTDRWYATHHACPYPYRRLSSAVTIYR